MTKSLTLIFLLLLSLSAAAQQQSASVDQPQQPGSQTAAADAAQPHIDEARRLWAENKPEQAEAEFQKAIAANPESAAARAGLAGLLLIQNKTAEAIPAYQDAITLDAENPRLFAALAIAYLHQSKFSMASAMASEALRLEPDMPQAQKLQDYIDAKLAVIEQAAQAATADGTLKPEDAIHGSSAAGHDAAAAETATIPATTE